MLNNKKKNAFTITELVIVIAVIAILAAVLIPTFSNVVEKAKESAALQEARNAMTEWTLRDDYNGESLENLFIVSGDYEFIYANGQLNKVEATWATNSYTFTFDGYNYSISSSEVTEDVAAVGIAVKGEAIA